MYIARTTAYAYDLSGNRTQMLKTYGSNTETTNYTYSKGNKLLRKSFTDNGSDGESITYYNYDKNGNLLSKVLSYYDYVPLSNHPYLNIYMENEFSTGYSNMALKPRLEYYGYNVFNHLVSYSNSNGTKASYAYMPDGLRASKTVGGIKTNEVWEGQDLIMEINSNNEISKLYEYGLDMIREKNSQTYYNYNAHGDVVQLTNSSGTVTQDYTYDAFGNETTKSTDTNPFRYCGEYADSESGLIYLRNRYYDPSLGRFINEDPAKDGDNWYSYCDGNPIKFFDMYGLAKEEKKLEYKFLDVPVFRQKNNNTCALANVSMTIAYYLKDNKNRESEIAGVMDKENKRQYLGSVYNSILKNKNSQDIVNWDYDVIPIYEKNYNAKNGFDYTLIKNEINAGNPVIVLYEGGSKGHFITVTGYWETDENTYIKYNDSGDGKKHLRNLKDMNKYDFGDNTSASNITIYTAVFRNKSYDEEDIE